MRSAAPALLIFTPRNMNHDDNGTSRSTYAGSETSEPVELGEFLDSAVKEGKAYFAAQKEYLTLEFYQKMGQAAGSMLGGLLAAVLILMFLMFASLALAFWLGTLFASTALGFLAVGGLYLLAFLIVHFIARDGIRGSFMLSVINSFYNDKD